MKNKGLVITFLLSSMLLSACDQKTTPSKPKVFKSFEEAASSVVNKHNYTTHVLTMFSEDEKTPFVEFNLYNLNDGAIYDDYSGYYSGYLKQKGQGIVNFNATLDMNTLILGSFVATNTSLGISEIFSLASEHILDKSFTFSEEREAYVCSDWDAIAVIADLGVGIYAEVVSSPLDFTATFADNQITITSVYDYVYFDLKEIHATFTVTLTISNIENTKNKVLENYIRKPDYVFVAPTEWDTGIKEDYFDKYFNSDYPPFINGLSYSWHYGEDVSEGNTVTLVEDYYAGNLIDSYVALLEAAGYKKGVNPEYVEYFRTVEDDVIVHKYYVKMKYFAPTDIIKGTNIPYGYLYPNGVTVFKFLHKTAPKETIKTIGQLEEYLPATAVGNLLPKFDLPDDTRVSGFYDDTQSQPSLALLAKGIGSEFFKIYPESKEKAIEFVNDFNSKYEALGFEVVDAHLFGQYWLSDDYGSVIRITNPSTVEDWDERPYIELRLEISNSTVEHHKNNVEEE